MRRIASLGTHVESLLHGARVRIQSGRGYVWVDDQAPAIVLIDRYYRHGRALDIYLDMLHELTHLRQAADGHALWDEELDYVDRPTEIEGYAVAVEEGKRLGMNEAEIELHLSNPWMTASDVRRLRDNIERFLANGGRTICAGA
jgi:hypothetical protein